METPCKICKSTRTRPIPGNRPGDHWVACRDCGSASPTRIRTAAELDEYWQVDRAVPDNRDPDDVWKLRDSYAKFWAMESRRITRDFAASSGQRILDVGCGLGETLKVFQDAGWTAIGIDPDRSLRFLHETKQVRVVYGQFETSEVTGNFDVISCQHAIYFLGDPEKFLHWTRERLNPNGILLIVASRMTSSIYSGRPGESHTWMPSPHSLRSWLIRNRFRILRVRYRSGSVLIVSEPCAEISIRGRFEAHLYALWSYLEFRSHHVRSRIFSPWHQRLKRIKDRVSTKSARLSRG